MTNKQLVLHTNGLPVGFKSPLYDFDRPGALAKAPSPGYESSELETKFLSHSYERCFGATKVLLQYYERTLEKTTKPSNINNSSIVNSLMVANRYEKTKLLLLKLS